MREMTLRELQLFSLEILKDVHQFCVEHNIQYSVSDGTMIGVVRHKGFIPWDDDIDIVMRRPDFEIFCKTYESTRFKLKYREQDKGCYVPYARVYDTERRWAKTLKPWCDDKDAGVCIDVFPVDGVPEDKEEFRRYYKLSRRLFRFNSVSRAAPQPFNLKKGLAYNAKLLAMKIIFLNGKTTDWLCRSVIRRAKAIKYGETRYWGNISSMCDGIMDYHRLETFTDVCLMDFEDTKVMVMNGYDEYLRDKYNDYMQLPPVEKRVAHLSDNNVFYWR